MRTIVLVLCLLNPLFLFGDKPKDLSHLKSLSLDPNRIAEIAIQTDQFRTSKEGRLTNTYTLFLSVVNVEYQNCRTVLKNSGFQQTEYCDTLKTLLQNLSFDAQVNPIFAPTYLATSTLFFALNFGNYLSQNHITSSIIARSRSRVVQLVINFYQALISITSDLDFYYTQDQLEYSVRLLERLQVLIQSQNEYYSRLKPLSLMSYFTQQQGRNDMTQVVQQWGQKVVDQQNSILNYYFEELVDFRDPDDDPDHVYQFADRLRWVESFGLKPGSPQRKTTFSPLYEPGEPMSMEAFAYLAKAAKNSSPFIKEWTMGDHPQMPEFLEAGFRLRQLRMEEIKACDHVICSSPNFVEVYSTIFSPGSLQDLIQQDEKD